MDKTLRAFLKDLIDAPGPSGFEQPVQEVFRRFVKPYADEIRTDVHGNVIARKKGSGKLRVIVEGHADEIGMMVNYITDEGFLYVRPIGGIDTAVLPALRVDIHHEGKVVRGVVGRPPIHVLEASDREKLPKFDGLWIDIGASKKKDAEKRVSIGDVITFGTGFETLNDDIVIARASDNKCGVFVAGAVLKALAGKKIPAEVYAVSAVQEEIGSRGARTSAFGIEPHAAIVIDMTFTSDIPDANKKKLGECSLGKGPSVAIGASINPVVLDRLKKAAKSDKIPCQIEVCPGDSGTDTDMIQYCRTGVATGLISIPNRYMHSPSEVFSLNDLENTVKLVTRFLLDLDDKVDFTPHA
jgi:tetrahedral aminopeptidase